MFEYEVNPKAEKERLAALEKTGKISGRRSDSISNMRGIERLDSIANHPASTVSRAACFTRKRWSASVTTDEQKIAECIQ